MNEDFPTKPPAWRLVCSECGHPMAIWGAGAAIQCQCPNKHCPQKSSIFNPRAAVPSLPEQSEPEPIYA